MASWFSIIGYKYSLRYYVIKEKSVPIKHALFVEVYLLFMQDLKKFYIDIQNLMFFVLCIQASRLYSLCESFFYTAHGHYTYLI